MHRSHLKAGVRLRKRPRAAARHRLPAAGEREKSTINRHAAKQPNRLFRARRGEFVAEGGAGVCRRERVLIQIEPEVERHQDFVVVACVLL
jgi:hypothetical protein